MGVRWKLGVALLSVVGLTGCASLPSFTAPPQKSPGWKQTGGVYVQSNQTATTSTDTANSTSKNGSGKASDNTVSKTPSKPKPKAHYTMPSDAELAQAAQTDIHAVVEAESKTNYKDATAILKTGATDQFYMNDAALVKSFFIDKGVHLDKWQVSINSEQVKSKSPTNASMIVEYTVQGQVIDSKGKVVSKMGQHKYKTYLWLVRTPAGWLIYNTAALG